MRGDADWAEVDEQFVWEDDEELIGESGYAYADEGDVADDDDEPDEDLEGGAEPPATGRALAGGERCGLCGKTEAHAHRWGIGQATPL